MNSFGHSAPLSFNSLDIDGDRVGDFTFGGVLHTSSSQFSPVGDARVGAEAVFIRAGNGVRLVRLYQNVISVEQYRESVLSDEATLSLEGGSGNARHSLVVLPGDKKKQDFIGVRSSCGLAAYDYRDGKIFPIRCITGLAGEWAMPGARADFDGDGIATTLSPFAGDIDGDGKPDLTFSGHRHMNEAGALYILFGRDLRHGMTTTIESNKIVKIAGGVMS